MVSECISACQRWGLQCRLQFQDAGVEAAFKESLEQHLLSWFCIFTALASAIIPICSWRMFNSMTRDEGRPDFSWRAHDPRTWTFLSFGALVVLSLMGWGLASAQLRWRWSRRVDWDMACAVFAAVFILIGVSFGNVWVSPSALGLSPSDVWGGDPRAYQPVSKNWSLCILMAACTVHLLFHRLVYLAALLVVLSLLVDFGLDNPFPDDAPSRGNGAASYVLMVVFVVVGAWRSEKRAREDWLRVRDLFVSLEERTTDVTVLQEIVESCEGEIDNSARRLLMSSKAIKEKDLELQARIANIMALESKLAELRKVTADLEEESRHRLAPLPSTLGRRCPPRPRLEEPQMSRQHLEGFMYQALKGRWLLTEGRAAAWLGSFTVNEDEDQIVLADGTTTQLRTSSAGGPPTLEGGKLFFEGNTLVRFGKGGHTCKYRRSENAVDSVRRGLDERVPGQVPHFGTMLELPERCLDDSPRG